VFVTRLDNGEPVAGARVSIVDRRNQTMWNGTTGADGVALAPDTPLRPRRAWFDPSLDFLVIAEKDGDVAYVGSDWTEGIEPWSFGTRFNLTEATPVLRGTVFADRGVYRLGEEVHVKAILRRDTPRGIDLPPAGSVVYVSLRDSLDREVDKREVRLGEWGSAEWIYTLPGEGALGNYSVQASLDKPEEGPPKLRPTVDEVEGDEVDSASDEQRRVVYGSFLVAAYRRPDFRVDATLTGIPDIAGATLKGTISARYLFGAALTKRPVRWTFTRTPVYAPPASLTQAFADERFTFVGYQEGARSERTDVKSDQATLDAKGELAVDLATLREAGLPYVYALEGDVEDVSRQHIANRASLTVHPAPWYVGVRRPSYFVDQKAGLDTALVTVSPEGKVVPGVDVRVTLRQVQWHSVRRAEGQGFYTWETERKEVEVGSWPVKTGDAPAPLTASIAEGGYYILRAEASDGEGRLARTEVSFYVLGAGYTAWTRYDHNRIDLVPEKARYKPGDTARIMIQSPWEQATALVTLEREGVRSHRRFALTSTQQAITVPIAEGDIPNVFVSVLLVKGRTEAGGEDDGSDPGKPTFRLGYVELQVDDASKHLQVSARAEKEVFRPANAAHVTVSVADADGKPAASEVTLWAVDYGVLSLTAFATPDVLRSVYVPKSLQVVTVDSRQRIVSRRVITPKGTDEGGGGGEEPGAGTLRKDFRVLAFWIGSVVTDASGRAVVDVKLPESLTTYRIMAVAGDKRSRFGSGESEIRINKPLTLKPTFPRFLARGDRATFGAVLTSQLREGGNAVVSIRSLDPGVLALQGEARKTVAVGAGGSVEVRFDARALVIGRARLQMTARLAGESDAFEDVLPVDVLASPETVAAYGEVTSTPALEKLTVPAGVVPGFGGLRVELASTAMVGLGEGARYLVEYPYGCAEQRASRALALLLAAELGEAFRIPGIEPAEMRKTAQAAITSLEKFQCPDGGFTYWAGSCGWRSSPYLTSYVIHVLRIAADLKYDVRTDVRSRAYAFLEEEMAAPPPPANDGWWPAYTAWQTFAVHELVAGGHRQDSNVTRLYGYLDRMPVFALAHLADAMAKSGETNGARVDELRRRMQNAVLPEGGSAHVEELGDPYLLWFWNSNVRSTAILLGHLARTGADDRLVPSLVRWLMAARTKGRWGNTQENAWALEGLVEYYKKYESEIPDFTAVVALGSDELAKQTFTGRSAAARTREVAMPALLAKAAPGTSRDLSFSKQGTGKLFYTTRLRYAADDSYQDGLDSGFAIGRSYAAVTEEGAAAKAAGTSFKAGDLVRVTLSFDLTKERRYVAVTDPLPAGFEAVESWFATTARDLVRTQDEESQPQDWMSRWQRGGFDHVERLDDRVRLFATRLADGHHEFSYIVRATTAGVFKVAPARAEEMYEPEVFGRTATTMVTVQP